jgi:hypothetical protein
MTDFRPWIRPTPLGPFATTLTYATLAILLSSGSAALVLPNGDRIDAWFAALLTLSFFAAMCVVGLLAADLFFLKLQLRRLPTYSRAWTSSVLAPVAVLALWMVFGWSEGSMPELVLSILWPFAAGPLALRFFFGERP